ncbi:hypothetical protein [Chryseobacterium sp.]|uniref:hypothetical protein n=1 Tax=Chryseobacterium sp. TaxID=1871047 RepID=UPI0025B97063|nr:hypothetical protein [Chryseobacterium sp.]
MNRKKILTIAVFAIMSTSCYSQVGINTRDPQQALHISGTGTGTSQATMRIEGLNSQNNPAHEDASSSKRVFSDSNGSFVIARNDQVNKSYLITPLPNTSVSGGTEQLVTTQSFILEYPSIVHIEARVGMSITDHISTEADLKDGQARLFGSYYKFSSAPSSVLSNTSFGQTIISHSTNTEEAQLDGVFYIEPRKDLSLPKGSYTIALYGYSQDNKLNFAVNSLNQTSQQMAISITPLSY